jgi:hypothetical protein
MPISSLYGILLAAETVSVTAGARRKGGINAKSKVSFSSSGFIVQPRFGAVGLFGWDIIFNAIGLYQRYRVRQWVWLGERFRFWYWFRHHKWVREQHFRWHFERN